MGANIFREAMRLCHMSPKPEKAYVHWIRQYILFHGKSNPDDMYSESSTSSKACRAS